MSEHPATNLGLATVDAVAMDGIKDIGTTLLDSIMVPLLEDTVLDNIPGIGVLFKLYKVKLAVRDRIFLANVGRFLFQLKDVPEHERQAFVRDMNEDQVHKQRVGDNVLLLLDRVDDVEKSQVHGEPFQLYVRRLVDYDTYRRYSGIIDRIYIPDLHKLLQVADIDSITEPGVSRTEQFALYSLGLSTQPIIRDSNEVVSTSLTSLGLKLRDLLMAAYV